MGIELSSALGITIKYWFATTEKTCLWFISLPETQKAPLKECKTAACCRNGEVESAQALETSCSREYSMAFLNQEMFEKRTWQR